MGVSEGVAVLVGDVVASPEAVAGLAWKPAAVRAAISQKKTIHTASRATGSGECRITQVSPSAQRWVAGVMSVVEVSRHNPSEKQNVL